MTMIKKVIAFASVNLSDIWVPFLHDIDINVQPNVNDLWYSLKLGNQYQSYHQNTKLEQRKTG
jgi:hypothetical protein